MSRRSARRGRSETLVTDDSSRGHDANRGSRRDDAPETYYARGHGVKARRTGHDDHARIAILRSHGSHWYPACDLLAGTITWNWRHRAFLPHDVSVLGRPTETLVSVAFGAGPPGAAGTGAGYGAPAPACSVRRAAVQPVASQARVLWRSQSSSTNLQPQGSLLVAALAAGRPAKGKADGRLLLRLGRHAILQASSTRCPEARRAYVSLLASLYAKWEGLFPAVPDCRSFIVFSALPGRLLGQRDDRTTGSLMSPACVPATDS
jgi:hypothetical protein